MIDNRLSMKTQKLLNFLFSYFASMKYLEISNGTFERTMSAVSFCTARTVDRKLVRGQKMFFIFSDTCVHKCTICTKIIRTIFFKRKKLFFIMFLFYCICDSTSIFYMFNISKYTKYEQVALMHAGHVAFRPVGHNVGSDRGDVNTTTNIMTTTNSLIDKTQTLGWSSE